jgi:hypothetical protein
MTSCTRWCPVTTIRPKQLVPPRTLGIDPGITGGRAEAALIARYGAEVFGRVVSSSPMKIGSPTYHALLRSEDIIGPLTEQQRRELSALLQQFRDTAKTDGIPEVHRPVYDALLRIEDIVGSLTERKRRELSDLLRDFRFAARAEVHDEARDARVAD